MTSTDREVSLEARYTSAAHAERERRAVFDRAWLVAAPTSALGSDAGSYVRVPLGTATALLVRGDDGGVRAFRDTCPHRGRRLSPGDGGCFGDAVVCPYHQARFALDGSLVHMPGSDGFARADLDALRLFALRVEARHGMIWVSADPHGPSLADHLGAADAWLAPYGLADWVVTGHARVDLRANWKASLDVHNESFHVRALHPEVLGLVDASSVQIDHEENASRIRSRMFRPSPERDGALDPRLEGLCRALGVDATLPTVERERAMVAAIRARDVGGAMDALDDDALLENRMVHVFPTAQFNLHRDHGLIFLHRPHPTDPGRSTFEQIVMARAGERGGAWPPELVTHDAAAIGPVTAADLVAAEGLQEGLLGSGMREARWHAEEAVIARTHARLDRALREEARRQGGG